MLKWIKRLQAVVKACNVRWIFQEFADAVMLFFQEVFVVFARLTSGTNADRIDIHKDEKADGNYVGTRVILTDEWIRLFESVGINYLVGDLRSAMLQQTEKVFFDRFIHLLRLTLRMRNSISGTSEDYLISPVRNSSGTFYDSRCYNDTSSLPPNADANSAFNIARKAAWTIAVLKNTQEEDLLKAKIAITNKEWLAYAQMT